MGSLGIFCSSNTLRQSTTQCNGQGGEECQFSCTEGYEESGLHVCNGNFTSPHAGMFIGGTCTPQLNLAPSVQTTMGLENIDGSVCAEPVEGERPCTKAAVQRMLVAQFGDAT